GGNSLLVTYRARSGETSWGTHAMFSVSTNGGSTSESTPTTAGIFGLLLSYGLKAYEDGLIDHPLTNAEAIQIMRATAEDIVNPNPPHGWKGTPGWDMQYGYGRPNVNKAMQMVKSGDIPPTGWIQSPRWYQLYDPTQTNTVTVKGHVAAPRSSSYTYMLEYAPGANPATSDFEVAGQGGGSAPKDTVLGKIDLSTIPKSFWNKAYKLSDTKYLRTNDEYTVTLKLIVTDADGRTAVNRRAIAVHHDSSLKKGY